MIEINERREYMKQMDKPFAYKLFDWIDLRGMTDVECYKKANVDKKTFSKIKCNPRTYKPSKQTAVAFAIALAICISVANFQFLFVQIVDKFKALTNCSSVNFSPINNTLI